MDQEALELILKDRGEDSFDVIEALQDIQAQFGYLPEEALLKVSESLDVPLIEVFRLANFYKSFSLLPRGRHLITVCIGTACHVQGAKTLAEEILGLLKVKPGKITEDGAFTVETVNCLGACALAPLVIIDGKYYSYMDSRKLRDHIEDIRWEDKFEMEKEKPEEDA